MRVPTAAGLRRLSQPARRAPSCIGLTSRGGTGMAGRCHRSWFSSASSASMYRAYIARKHRHVGATAAGLRLAQPARGGSLMHRAHLARWHRHERPTAAGLRRPPQPAQGLVIARSPSKQLYFATYFQPRSSRYGRAFLARRHRPEPLQSAVLRHLHQPTPRLSL